jgi:uncharacterized membrane protein HdeD (DUF308 family)
MFRMFFTDGSRNTQIPKGAVVWELLVALVYFLVGGYLLSHLTASLAVITVALGIYLFLEAILEFVRNRLDLVRLLR